MKFTKDDLNLENGLKREWLLTNGIGGFASSTIIGANTRKYHGLLIAPLKPPAKRYLVLAKVDESIQIENNKYNLYTNVGENYISQGFKYQESFEKDYFPTYTYKIEDVEISKTICMKQGKNIVGIYYKIKNSNKTSKLTLAPIVNFRDFHAMSTDHVFNVKQKINGTKVKLIIDGNSDFPIYMNLSEGKYVEHQNDIFKDMFYIEEEKRGFYPKENHSVAGVYEVELMPNEEKEISFVCGVDCELGGKNDCELDCKLGCVPDCMLGDNIENIDVKDILKEEKQRIDNLIKKTELIKTEEATNGNNENKVKNENNQNKKNADTSKEKEEFIKELIKAADQFIVYRPSFKLHTIIAGYPWFLDWGRDSLIAFEGLLLKTKRYDIAKEVLLTFVKDIKDGLVPNGYAEADNKPLYNSADASLLLFEQVKKYIDYTGDYEFIKENVYEKLKEIIENYEKGIDLDNNNIYLDTDYLISSGTENTQNTWMDAKYGNMAATPRNGKAVEINSLWYNSLMIMAELTEKIEQKEIENKSKSKSKAKAETTTEMKLETEEKLKVELAIKKYKNLARKCKKSFNDKFYNSKRKCLYDVLGDNKIRPNQLFALSVTYPIIKPDSEEAYNIINTVDKKLLNNYGLKTLAKGEPNYIEIYEGNGFKRDMSYHQGITWTWLLGLYCDSLKNMIKSEKRKTYKEKLEKKLDEFVKRTIETFEKEINQRGCVGSIAEIYDSSKPYEPKGAIAQAWSVGAIGDVSF